MVWVMNELFKSDESRLDKCMNLNIQICKEVGWLVGYFGFNDPLRQYFSLGRRLPESWLVVLG